MKPMYNKCNIVVMGDRVVGKTNLLIDQYYSYAFSTFPMTID